MGDDPKGWSISEDGAKIGKSLVFLVCSASSTTSEMSFLFMVVFWIVEDGLGMVKRSCCMGSWGECGSEWVYESSSTKWLVAHVKSLD